jgi:hypothetical protein
LQSRYSGVRNWVSLKLLSLAINGELELITPLSGFLLAQALLQFSIIPWRFDAIPLDIISFGVTALGDSDVEPVEYRV